MLDFREQVSGHLYRSDISEGHQGKTDDVLVRVVQITVVLLVHCPQASGIEPNFFKEFVTNVRTSWFSSSSNIVPRYPKRLSANRGEASSLRHSIWPKWVRSPSVKRYNSLATLFRLYVCEHHSPIAIVVIVYAYRTLESWLSSLKLALIAALSFCTTALSSAIVFAARTFRMNCLTVVALYQLWVANGRSRLRELMLAVSRTPSWSLKVVARRGIGGWQLNRLEGRIHPRSWNLLYIPWAGFNRASCRCWVSTRYLGRCFGLNVALRLQFNSHTCCSKGFIVRYLSSLPAAISGNLESVSSRFLPFP